MKVFFCVYKKVWILSFDLITLGMKSWQGQNAIENESATQWWARSETIGWGEETNWKQLWRVSSVEKWNEKASSNTTIFLKIIGSLCSIIKSSSQRRLKNMQRTIFQLVSSQWFTPKVWGLKRQPKHWKRKNFKCWRKVYGAGLWHAKFCVSTWEKYLQVTWWSKMTWGGCVAKNLATSNSVLNGSDSTLLHQRNNDNPMQIKKFCSSGWKIKWWNMEESKLLKFERRPNCFWGTNISRSTNTFKTSAGEYGNSLVGRQMDAKVFGFPVRV